MDELLYGYSIYISFFGNLSTNVGGDTVNIKAKVTDDISGVKQALITFTSPSGNSDRGFHLKEINTRLLGIQLYSSRA